VTPNETVHTVALTEFV